MSDAASNLTPLGSNCQLGLEVVASHVSNVQRIKDGFDDAQPGMSIV